MPDSTWYKNVLTFAVDVQRIQDADGGGMGDFAGPISRLDYLQERGVTCLWLLLFYPSPYRGDGYDPARRPGFAPFVEQVADPHAAGLRPHRPAGP